MRISVAAKHRYPASRGGPSGGRVYDFLVKGLAQLGHEVTYYLQEGTEAPLPEGVRSVSEPCWEADIWHCRSDVEHGRIADARGLPWVATCHADLLLTWNRPRDAATDNWIFVSRTLAETYGRRRFVLNGIDPDELIYSETKEDYLLFVAALQFVERKGLEIAIRLARQAGLPLVVAGSSPDRQLVDRIGAKCNAPGIRYVGEVSGAAKAELFAGAKALLFPTQLNEGFGLVMAEALMSGTPVICSDFGACPELISPDVGFVCHTDEDYLCALQQLDERKISPQRCREVALERFHYLRMARDYVREYEREISK
ncbi:MAG: glycosyltransferase [Planctomycetota bacterium]